LEYFFGVCVDVFEGSDGDLALRVEEFGRVAVLRNGRGRRRSRLRRVACCLILGKLVGILWL